MKEIENLTLLNVDFTDFSFKHRPLKKDEKPKIVIQQDYKFQGPTAQNKVICFSETKVTGDDDSFTLILHSASIFDIKERNEFNEGYNELIINLIYPYIREKIISLTSGPFASPIIMPLKVENLSKKQQENQIS